MRVRECRNRQFGFALVGLLLIVLLHAFPVLTYAQNLGQQPAPKSWPLPPCPWTPGTPLPECSLAQTNALKP
jgi:hypothetical protein